jgi:hypothetical protein
MSCRPTVSALLFALCVASLLAGTASAAEPGTAGDPSTPIGFKLQGSHGYSITVSAYAPETAERGAIGVTASRGHDSVSYEAPAKVTEDSIRADLGTLGRVDLVLHPSGRVKTAHVRCLRHDETYEAGAYEGTFEFNGEGGFTRARTTRVAALPALPLIAGGFCGERSSGESRGPNEPGARLGGVSYAHGRTLKLQINKNRPGGRTLFSASLSERRNGIRIHRELAGTAPARAFRYGPKLRTATLSLPPPFSGSASLRRNPNAVSPLLTGDLTLAFPGRSVGVHGPDLHVSLVHARLEKGNNASTIGISF